MKKLFSFLFVAAFVSNSLNIKAQSSICGQFHRQHCDPGVTKDDSREFLYNSQSRSGLFSQGSVSKLRCIIYKGMDYRLTICCETAETQVNFKIFDAKTNEELFDNAKNENVLT